ncbi:hypothetical protein CDIK_0940 [Cucumispora dikerogammari]|nr:hypothetical protein CDIK_0940 [Cucumispora dikerogammari]
MRAVSDLNRQLEVNTSKIYNRRVEVPDLLDKMTIPASEVAELKRLFNTGHPTYFIQWLSKSIEITYSRGNLYHFEEFLSKKLIRKKLYAIKEKILGVMEKKCIDLKKI